MLECLTNIQILTLRRYKLNLNSWADLFHMSSKGKELQDRLSASLGHIRTAFWCYRHNNVLHCQHLRDNSWLLTLQEGCEPSAGILQEHVVFIKGVPGSLLHLLPDSAKRVELVIASVWPLALSPFSCYQVLWSTSTATLVQKRDKLTCFAIKDLQYFVPTIAIVHTSVSLQQFLVARYESTDSVYAGLWQKQDEDPCSTLAVS